MSTSGEVPTSVKRHPRAASPSGAFVRNATGLVKEAGVRDIFIYNANNQNMGLGVLFILLFLGFYPGANMEIGTILTMLLTLPFVAVYAFFAGAMPRSGGDYVYNSRILAPVVGFVSSFNWLFYLLVYVGQPAAYLTQYGIAPWFRIMGSLTGNSTLIHWSNSVAGEWGTIIGGTIMLVLFALIFIRGIELYFRIQNLGFVLLLVSVLLMIIGALIGAGDFQHHINSYVAGFGGPHNAYKVIEAAGAKGGYTPSPFSWHSTFLLMSWVIFIIPFSITSSQIGGEVKSAQRTQFIGMPGAVLFVTAGLLILEIVFHIEAGTHFLGALGVAAPASYGAAFPMYMQELAAAGSGSAILGTLIGLTFIFFSYVWLPINFLASTRILLAWSLDRLLPERVSYVSPRTHTPVVSIVIVFILGEILMILYATGAISVLSGIFGWMISFILTAIAAIVFPYRRPDLFEASPINWRWRGVPVITIVGSLALIGLIIMEWILFVDPLVGMVANNPTAHLMDIVTPAVLIAGILLYTVSRFVQDRRGINVEHAFAEIPPE